MWPSLLTDLIGLVALVVGSWRIISGSGSLGDSPVSSGRIEDIRVVIPARDEAENLSRLLTSLYEDGSVTGPSIIVVDDGSTDATSAVAHLFGCKVIDAPEPEDTSNGKSSALASIRSVLLEGPDSGRITFVDADVTFGVGSLERLYQRSLDLGGLVSVQPYHATGGFSESMAIFFNVVSLVATGAFVPRSKGDTKAIFGPVLICGIGDYRRSGGHSAVLGDVLDDVGLGRAFRESGQPTKLFVGHGSIEFRMYPGGFGELVSGFRKNIALGARSTRSWWSILGFLVVMGALSAGVVEPLRSVSTHGAERIWVTVVAYAIWVVFLWFVARRVGRFSLLSYLLFPFALLVFLMVLAISTVDVFRGKVKWKGRTIRLGPRT